jgi:hypothetical protein
LQFQVSQNLAWILNFVATALHFPYLENIKRTKFGKQQSLLFQVLLRVDHICAVCILPFELCMQRSLGMGSPAWPENLGPGLHFSARWVGLGSKITV